MKNTCLLFSASAALFLASCKKDSGTNETSSQGNIIYQLSTESGSPGTAGETGRTAASYLTWTGGTASVSEIKFEAKGPDKVEYKSKVPQLIDLSNPTSTIGGISVPFGTYKKVEFKIKFVPTATHPALELLGTYTPTGGGAPVPVILQFAEPFELKFEKKTPTTIDANTNYTALSTLALHLLSASVSESLFRNATQTNGTILISRNANTELYHPLWNFFQGLLKVEIKKK